LSHASGSGSEPPPLAARSVGGADGDDAPALVENFRRAHAQLEFPAERLEIRGDLFPHLAGAELGIKETLDQRRFHVALRDILGVRLHRFLDRMLQRLEDRQTLDTLRAPFGADLMARHAPHLFRVGAEERVV